MRKRAKTVSINLRLPAELHKKLVEAGVSASPATSLNSEILSRLFESFERPGLVQLEKQLSEMKTDGEARIKDLQLRADKATQLVQNTLAEFYELKQRVDKKLK